MRLPLIQPPLLLLVGSLLPLGLALLSQYGFGLFPCELCLWQRWPYVLVLAAGLVAFWQRRHPHRLRLLLLVGIAGWLATASIAAYHVGVEQQWWDSATGCTAQGGGTSAEDIRAAIMGSPLVSCADAGVSFLGLSMAGWNAVAALALAGYAAALMIRSRATDDPTSV